MLLNLDLPDGARLLWRAQERSFHYSHLPRDASQTVLSEMSGRNTRRKRIV